MRYIFILIALLCVSCGTSLPSIKPYKLDIQQGNVVTSKMLLQLRPGMTKSQVRFIMGTPLVQDSFHGNRWDYVYQMREAGKIKEQRRVILDFENELLKTVRGDVVAAGSEQAKENEAAAPTGTRVVTPLKAPEEKGMLDKLKFWKSDEQAAEKEAAEKTAKAKLEAEQAAKQAAPAMVASEPVANESASMLAVPVEAAATPTSSPEAVPVAEPPIVTQAAEPPAMAQAVESPKVPAPIIEAVPVMVPEPAAVAAPVAENEPLPTQAPVNPNHYQSSAGMQFDRKLQIEDEELPPVVEPSGARTGNKVAPKPKTLPQETEPSFFDRMLEQIGF